MSNGSRARLRYPGQPEARWSMLSRLRTRRAVPTSTALDLVEAMAAAHDGDLCAVLGELVARVDALGGFRERGAA